MRFKEVRLGGLAVLALGITGCSAFYSPFSFPTDQGNIVAGRQAFVDQHCHQCHSVAGVNLPSLAGASTPILALGGEIHSVKSYGELVTSIIKPNHIISERYREQLALDSVVPVDSPMPTPDLDNMSVQQLLDIVAFLDSRYELIEDYQSESE